MNPAGTSVEQASWGWTPSRIDAWIEAARNPIPRGGVHDGRRIQAPSPPSFYADADGRLLLPAHQVMAYMRRFSISLAFIGGPDMLWEAISADGLGRAVAGYGDCPEQATARCVMSRWERERAASANAQLVTHAAE